MSASSSPTPSAGRKPRGSCRVGCVFAALLVLAGGLPLLTAAEPARAVEACPIEAARVEVAPTVRGPAAVPAPVDLGAYPVTTSDFAAAVEHTARRVECSPVACGFPRARPLDETALDWTALERRVVPVTWRTREAPQTLVLRPHPVAWVHGSTCGLGCPEGVLAPDALAARF